MGYYKILVTTRETIGRWKLILSPRAIGIGLDSEALCRFHYFVINIDFEQGIMLRERGLALSGASKLKGALTDKPALLVYASPHFVKGIISGGVPKDKGHLRRLDISCPPHLIPGADCPRYGKGLLNELASGMRPCSKNDPGEGLLPSTLGCACRPLYFTCYMNQRPTNVRSTSYEVGAAETFDGPGQGRVSFGDEVSIFPGIWRSRSLQSWTRNPTEPQ